MIFGFVDIENNSVTTNRDTFILDTVSVVSVRKPFLAGSLLLSSGLLGFSLAFMDLLYVHEIATLGGVSIGLIVIGTKIGQLSLLSRDLKGTELSSAVWGTPRSLQTKRTEIIKERQRAMHGGSHDNG